MVQTLRGRQHSHGNKTRGENARGGLSPGLKPLPRPLYKYLSLLSLSLSFFFLFLFFFFSSASISFKKSILSLANNPAWGLRHRFQIPIPTSPSRLLFFPSLFPTLNFSFFIFHFFLLVIIFIPFSFSLAMSIFFNPCISVHS